MVNEYKPNIQLSEHFNSSEFACPCCGKIKIDTELISMLETLYKKVNANSILITSGYRCPKEDMRVGKFVGKHAAGLAADIKVKGSDNKYISTKYLSCTCQDLFARKQGVGIANINKAYTAMHLDNRKNGHDYLGNEIISNNTVTDDFYSYYNIKKEPASKPDIISYSGVSLVDCLKTLGKDASYRYRSKLARSNGIYNYNGSASQNTKLLNMIKKGVIKWI